MPRTRHLYEPVTHDGGERGANWTGHTRESSAYTKAALRPGMAAATFGAAAVVAAAAVLARNRR